jgi:acetyl-CoA C-acetyltransferase
MEGIRDKVAIVGMGCTKFGERWDMGVEDLLVEAAYEAFQDAGIEPKDIEAAWLGTVFSGLSAMTLSPLLRELRICAPQAQRLSEGRVMQLWPACAT